MLGLVCDCGTHRLAKEPGGGVPGPIQWRMHQQLWQLCRDKSALVYHFLPLLLHLGAWHEDQ